MKASTYGRITEEGLDELRRQIGVERSIRPHVHEYVMPDFIRAFAIAVGDPNPLWHDPDYAQNSCWGGSVAPPLILHCMRASWSPGTTGLPGVLAWYAGEKWTFHAPVRSGDRISMTALVTGIREKQTRFTSGRTIFVDGEIRFADQQGKRMATLETIEFRAEKGQRGEAGGDGDNQGGGAFEGLTTHRYTDEDIAKIEQDYLSEEVRGATPRYWEDVAVGDVLTPVVKGPLKMTDIVSWISVWRSYWTMSLRWFVEYRKRHPTFGTLDPELNVMDTPERVHWDRAYVRGLGFPDCYDFGPMRVCWLGHLIHNWMGDAGVMWSASMQARKFNFIGDTQWCRGTVTRTYLDGEDHLVEIDVYCENQRGQHTVVGSFTVALPSRGTASDPAQRTR